MQWVVYTSPQADTPLGKPLPGQTPPPRDGNLRVVRILLEYILVLYFARTHSTYPQKYFTIAPSPPPPPNKKPVKLVSKNGAFTLPDTGNIQMGKERPNKNVYRCLSTVLLFMGRAGVRRVALHRSFPFFGRIFFLILRNNSVYSKLTHTKYFVMVFNSSHIRNDILQFCHKQLVDPCEINPYS